MQSSRTQDYWDIYGDKYPDFWSKGPAPCSVDPDAMFPEGRGMHSQEQRMVVVCNGCPYLAECRQFAIENDEWGVWGGTTREQRKVIRKELGYV